MHSLALTGGGCCSTGERRASIQAAAHDASKPWAAILPRGLDQGSVRSERDGDRPSTERLLGDLRTAFIEALPAMKQAAAAGPTHHDRTIELSKACREVIRRAKEGGDLAANSDYVKKEVGT